MRNGKRYARYLLRESYWQDGKVKKRTVANLSSCSQEELNAIKLALANKADLTSLGNANALNFEQGKSIGALLALEAIATQVGLDECLGPEEQGRIALWQVFSRIIEQGSRCSALRLLDMHLGQERLNLPEKLTPYRLYKNLAWLCEHQEEIELKLWQRRSQDRTTDLFLYDVTSSYFEGVHNELAAYGYNRDKKSGKKQIVIGLLTDDGGDPVAVRVFQGNTSDGQTVKTQIEALQNQFKVNNVTLVGDRAMFKLPQIETLPEDFSYISALTKPEIRTLLNLGVIQLDLFDKNLCEVEHEGVRYIMRRNPEREKELKRTRQDKFKTLKTLIARKNAYLTEHPRAQIETAIKEVKEKAHTLKIQDWLAIDSQGRSIHCDIETEKYEEAGRLDGCYCLKTDLSADRANMETVNARYGDLQSVESAFRSMKQTHLELRPIYLRREDHTRGHVFVVMLSYLLQRRLQQVWKKTQRPVPECLSLLSTLVVTHVSTGARKLSKIPQPNPMCRELLNLVGATVPHCINERRNRH